jgi:hypothetical protein
VTEGTEILLSDAALRLGISWHRAWRLVLTGQLIGRKEDNRWLVGEESVTEFEEAERKRKNAAVQEKKGGR